MGQENGDTHHFREKDFDSFVQEVFPNYTNIMDVLNSPLSILLLNSPLEPERTACVDESRR